MALLSSSRGVAVAVVVAVAGTGQGGPQAGIGTWEMDGRDKMDRLADSLRRYGIGF